MARLNIEDTLWSDPRLMKLVIKFGDEEKALGRLIFAWRLAQKYWCPDKAPIPAAAWESANLGRELIEVGLAREADGGVYVAGSEEQFSWWFQRQAAGKRGGLAKASGTKRSLADAKRCVPSSSSSFSKKEEEEGRLTPTGLLEIWNSNRGGLPAATKLSDPRRRAALRALKENDAPEYWVGLVKWLSQSDWHNGRDPKADGWTADFDFLLQNGKHIKLADRMLKNSGDQSPALKTLADLRDDSEVPHAA